MSDGSKPHVDTLLRRAIDSYKQALQVLEDNEYDKLDDILDRRQQLLEKVKSSLETPDSLDASPSEQLCDNLIHIESKFIEEVERQLDETRDELVEQKAATEQTTKYQQSQ